MKKLILRLLLLTGLFSSLLAAEPPKFLYKVISVNHWEDNDTQDPLPLTEEDVPFIHLATEEQLDRILDKYWALKNYMILKLETDQLPGCLVFEANPGGTTPYYHLYQGSLPRKAIVAVFADRHTVHY